MRISLTERKERFNVEKKKLWQTGVFGIFVAAFFCLDQWTKSLSVHYLKNTSGVVLIPDVFELQYVENRGAAFGILQNQRLFLVLLSVFILFLLCFLYWKIPIQKRYLPLRLCAVLLAAGAVGNMTDRMMLGYVVDFFYFKWIDFPVFNVADCYVVISVIFAFVLLCFYYTEEELDIFQRKNTED